jgi:UMF1 family MFS transporter
MVLVTARVTDLPESEAGGGPQSTRRERVGWYFYNFADHGFYTVIISVFFGPYLTSIAKTAAGCAADADSCSRPLVHAFGLAILPGSVFPYTVSLSVLLQVIVLPVAGAMADRTSHKKQLMAGFAYVGAAATVALLFLVGDRWLIGCVLFVVANLALGGSAVIYNSFLPQLAGPDARDRVSSIGWAFGYVGGGLLLALAVVAVFLRDSLGMSTGEVARWSIVAAGIWWAGFTVVPLLLLRNRPASAGDHPRGHVLADAFRQLTTTLRSLRAYPLSLFFLLAYLIYNDGIQAVISLAAVYATEELKLSQEVLVPTILMVQFVAFFGALLLGWMAGKVGARRTVLGSLIAWTALLGGAYFIPARHAILFVALAGLIGLVLGGSQALSRSLFSQIIPRGREGEYFGLYEISDKGTSWLAPLLFGLAFSLTDSYRIAIVSLVVFFVVGFISLLAVPMRRAILAVGNQPPRLL